LSSLYSKTFKHPGLIYIKSDYGNFKCFEFNMFFLSRLLFGILLGILLKEIFLASNSEKIVWSNKFLKVPPCRVVF
jgi:hypothetical protein